MTHTLVSSSPPLKILPYGITWQYLNLIETN